MLRKSLSLSLLLLLGGCVSAPPPKVAIENLQSDILFGARTGQVAPEAGPVAQFPTQPDIPEFDFGPLIPAPQRVTTRPSDGGPCPTAPFTAVPEEAAGTNVPAPPKDGAYRWKRSGAYTYGGVSYALSGLERRVLRRVTSEADPSSSSNGQIYRWETIQPIATNLLYIRWLVKTNGAGASAADPTGTAPPVSARDPEAGLVMKGFEITNLQNVRQDFFLPPGVGLLLLPVPVTPGGSFMGESSDPAAAERWQISGKVLGRERIDACGDVVEGWAVESTISISGSRSGTLKFDYLVAPHLGAIIISEKFTGDQHLFGAATQSQYSLGQLKPDALAASEK